MLLTRRELEIARMAAGGDPPRSIAEKTSLSVRTIENTLLVICTKLNISSVEEVGAALRERRSQP